MPTANIPASNQGVNFTWVNRWNEDFLTPMAKGDIYPATSGDLGMLNPLCAAYPVYGSKWKVKQALSNDTDGNARYNAIETTYIQDSCLIIHDHVSQTNGPVGGAIKPLGQSASDINYMTYGRVAHRWRAVANPVTGGRTTGTNWGAVSFFIPDNANFPEWSEMDWLEAKLDSLNPGGFWHPGGDDINNSIHIDGIGVPFSEWHTTVIEWMPDPAGARIIWYDNGIECLNTTTDTAVSPAELAWLIQTGSSGGVPTGEGYVQIDWISLWEYQA